MRTTHQEPEPSMPQEPRESRLTATSLTSQQETAIKALVSAWNALNEVLAPSDLCLRHITNMGSWYIAALTNRPDARSPRFLYRTNGGGADLQAVLQSLVGLLSPSEAPGSINLEIDIDLS